MATDEQGNYTEEELLKMLEDSLHYTEPFTEDEIAKCFFTFDTDRRKVCGQLKINENFMISLNDLDKMADYNQIEMAFKKKLNRYFPKCAIYSRKKGTILHQIGDSEFKYQ